jgi:hypothetical protein
MKKFALIGAMMAALAAVASASPAQAGFKGCCGGWQGGGWGGGFHHWHGGGLSVGLIDTGVIGGECYYVRRAVFVPGIGMVSKRDLVCS